MAEKPKVNYWLRKYSATTLTYVTAIFVNLMASVLWALFTQPVVALRFFVTVSFLILVFYTLERLTRPWR